MDRTINNRTINKKIDNVLHDSINQALELIKASISKSYEISDKNKIKGDNPVTDIDIETQNLILKKEHEILKMYMNRDNWS